MLKTIQRMRKATPADLAQKLGLPYTTQDLTTYLKLLEKENFVNRVEENPVTYRLSNLGLIAVGALPEMAKKVFLPVPLDKCFLFYVGSGTDKFTGMSACNLSDFREKAQTVNVESLEFHVRRGDVEKWIRDVLGDEKLADEIKRVRSMGLDGEVLRTRFLEILDSRIKQLTSSV